MAKKSKNLKFYEAIGRRKESTARVRFYITDKSKKAKVGENEYKEGSMLINSKDLDEYFPRAVDQKRFIFPLELTENVGRFVVSIKVQGGGKQGQLEAIIHGLSRALVLVDEEYKSKLKEHDLMTRDPRTRERRKVGTGGKARRQKQSPKR